MEYRTLGQTGLKISRLMFGGAHIGEIIGSQETEALVHKAWDVGINTFYMSDKYNNGQGEEILGSAIKPRRDDCVLVIKVGYRVGSGDVPVTDAERLATHGEMGSVDHAAMWRRGVSPNSRGLSRKHILQAVDASLKRLQTDYIDVYEAHFWDYETPVEETLSTFQSLIDAGKVRYIGCSQTKAWQVCRALWASDKQGTSRYQSWQVLLNMIDRGKRAEQLEAAAQLDMSVLAFQSLAGGILSGQYTPGSVVPEGMGHRRVYLESYWREKNFALVDALRPIAQAGGRTGVGELAQAWTLSQGPVAALQVGPTRPEEFDSYVGAVSKPLTPEEAVAIDEVLDRYPGEPTGAMYFPDPR
jgi:aryl-alcohol dehydrogenase-like predicted oxidoreductase